MVKTYEVKEDVIIEESDIGKRIGKVKTEPYYSRGAGDKMKYYGNASNNYPIGTQYYEIKGIPTSDAITIKEDNHWVKAVYVEKAPFHIMNILTNPLFIFSIETIALILIGVIFRSKKSKTEN